MMKTLLLILSLNLYLSADLLHDTIKNIIGLKDYNTHRLLINNEFKHKDLFYIGNKLKYISVFKVLNDKGLVHLRFDKPKNVQIQFITKSDSIKFIKLIKDVFSSLGYAYYFTDSINKKNGTITWDIRFNSEAMLDPYIFLSELEKLEVIVNNVEKINDMKWKYEIDINYANISNTISITKDEKIKLQKPHKAYMLKVNDVKLLKVISTRLNNWYPRITFYDESLNILALFEKQRVYKGVKVNVQKKTKYILIDDTFTLLNIKRGLTVIVR